MLVTSGTYDLLLHIAVPDMSGVYAFVIDRLTEQREVADVLTTMVYVHVQSRVIEPADHMPERARGTAAPLTRRPGPQPSPITGPARVGRVLVPPGRLR